jgi:hypothetical protein
VRRSRQIDRHQMAVGQGHALRLLRFPRTARVWEYGDGCSFPTFPHVRRRRRVDGHILCPSQKTFLVSRESFFNSASSARTDVLFLTSRGRLVKCPRTRPCPHSQIRPEDRPHLYGKMSAPNESLLPLIVIATVSCAGWLPSTYRASLERGGHWFWPNPRGSG